MAKRYKCPYCGKMKERPDLVRHIEDKHSDLIPEGFTPLRIAFNSINYGNLDYCGKCTECGGPTKWDENKGRYDRQCSKKSCHDSFVKNFEKNMMRTKGVTRITQTIDGQEKMLANRGISKTYKFSDGTDMVYTGSYEGKALEFIDKVLHCKSEDIKCPGPTIQYSFNGKLHWYIPDIYYIPYNLIIEVKDGGDKPNNRNMPEYRAKQIAKEEHIIKNTNFNYLRLTDNDFSQLLAVMSDLKLQLVDKSGERVININENMFAAFQGMFPMKSEGVYVVNYSQNNAFSGDSDFAVSNSPKFDSVFYRDKEGKLRKSNHEIFQDCTYDLYFVDGVKSKFESAIKGNLDEFIEEGFIYEAIFGHKLYTTDQIQFEESAIPTMDYFEFINETRNMTHRYTMGYEGKSLIEMVNVASSYDSTRVSVGAVDITTGETFIESTFDSNLRAESNNKTQLFIMKVLENFMKSKGGVIDG